MKSTTILLLLLACAVVALPSCTVQIDPETGKPRLSTDPKSVQALTDAAADRINRELAEATK